MDIYDLISIRVCIFFPVRDWNQYSFHLHYLPAVEIPHREESPSLDRNFRNPFTEIPERLPVQSIQSDTQN